MFRRGLPVLLLATPLGAASWLHAQVMLEPEKEDNPPAAHAAREDALARSPGLLVGFGSYQSIQVNVDGAGHNIVGDAANEPSIAVNPTNPSNMVIGWRQFDHVSSNFRQAGWAYTFDGGLTWTFPGVLTPGTFRSDPSLDADSHGTFYYQSLKSDFTADVFRSTDGGMTWLPPVAEFGGDKNWMAIDRSGGIGDGNIYGIWQRFSACCGSNVLTRSTDGGASFESPVPVAFSPTFGTLAVGPSGELYATGVDGTVNQDFAHFVMSKSTNAQNPAATPTFSGRRVNLGGSMASGGPNPAGLLGQGNVAVDRSTGSTRGNAYILASVTPTGGDPLDVHLIRSTNGGAIWTAPVRVNDDPSSANWQWFGAHSVAPNGRIDAIWNDTRNSGVSTTPQLFYAYSWDGGATWSANVGVSPPFDASVGYPNQNKIGDYYTLVSNATGADVAYAATFNGEQDVYYVRVFPDCNGNGVSDVTDTASGSSLDCDANHVPDECQAAPTCLGAGAVPDGGRFVQGAPLTIARVGTGDLELTWGGSCRADDTDYAVYEGTLGDFTSHTARFCTTGGQTTEVLTPASSDSYYLVVPTHADREGSYGDDSAGHERPQGHAACFPQLVRPCLMSFQVDLKEFPSQRD